VKRSILLGTPLLYCASLLSVQQTVSPANNLRASSAPPSALQSPPQLKTLDDRMAQRKAEHHIILNVAIRDERGNSVKHLSQKDFVLLDDARPQELQTFREMEGPQPMTPPHVVLVLDTLDNSAHELSDERKAVEAFLGRNQGRLEYPLSLAVVTDSGATVGKSSLDGNAIIAQLKNFSLVSHLDMQTRESSVLDRGNSVNLPTNGYAWSNQAAQERKFENLNRRFEHAVPAILHLALEQQDLPGRCLMIWIGPGWPMLSGSEFTPDPLHAQKSYFVNIVSLTNALRVGQVTVYNVSSRRLSGGEKEDYKNFLPPVMTVSQAKTGNLALPVLAIQSGGVVLNRSEDLVEEIASCIRDADSYYVLAFDSQPSKAEDEYHPLQVKIVSRPELSADTNKGYYDQP
jgi:VWFA-related protein